MCSNLNKKLKYFFFVTAGENILLTRRDAIITRAVPVLPAAIKNVQTALSTLTLNYAVGAVNRGDEERGVQAMSSLAMLFLEPGILTDVEAKFRTLVAVGTLLEDRRNARYLKELVKPGSIEMLRDAHAADKVGECAGFVIASL